MPPSGSFLQQITLARAGSYRNSGMELRRLWGKTGHLRICWRIALALTRTGVIVPDGSFVVILFQHSHRFPIQHGAVPYEASTIMYPDLVVFYNQASLVPWTLTHNFVAGIPPPVESGQACVDTAGDRRVTLSNQHLGHDVGQPESI